MRPGRARDGRLTLFLVDDHPVVGLGLSLALQGSSRFHLAGAITDPWLGLRTLDTVRPDGIVIDLVYDGEAQIELVREYRALMPDALIVVFSSLPRQIYEREARELGADAYINKSSDIAVLIETMAQLANQPRKAPAYSASVLLSSDTVIDGVHLTPREAVVAKRLGHGLSISRIATDLQISAKTVGVHRDNIRKKLRCRDMTELVALLARHNRAVHDSR